MGSRLGAIAMQALALILLGLGCATAQYSSCPEAYGLQLYPHEQYCDKFYKCANGTLYEEVCENGLVFDGHGAVHNHCNYNWAVDCGKRVYDDTPISSPGCLYQFGIYPVGEGCQTTFFKCAAGVAYETPSSTSATIPTRCHIARPSLRAWLGSNAHRPTSFHQMLLPGASSPSPGSQCPATSQL